MGKRDDLRFRAPTPEEKVLIDSRDKVSKGHTILLAVLVCIFCPAGIIMTIKTDPGNGLILKLIPALFSLAFFVFAAFSVYRQFSNKQYEVADVMIEAVNEMPSSAPNMYSIDARQDDIIVKGLDYSGNMPTAGSKAILVMKDRREESAYVIQI